MMNLYQKARVIVSVCDLWHHLGLPGDPSKGNVSSPWREDRDPSLGVFADGQKWMDHGTGEVGDIFDLAEKSTGSKQIAKEIVFGLAKIPLPDQGKVIVRGKIGRPGIIRSIPVPRTDMEAQRAELDKPTKNKKPPVADDTFEAKCMNAIVRAAAIPDWISDQADALGVPADIVESLVKAGAMGAQDDAHNNRILWIWPGTYQAEMKPGDPRKRLNAKGRHFEGFWLGEGVGENDKEIVVCEGCKDAVALLAAVRKKGRAIVAAPSATSLPKDLSIVKDRRILIAFDGDKPGMTGATKAAGRFLKAGAFGVRVLDWSKPPLSGHAGSDIHDLWAAGKSKLVAKALECSRAYDPYEDHDGVFTQNDSGNAERFCLMHRKTCRYCHELSSWYHWNGFHWIASPGETTRKGQAVHEAMMAEANKIEDDDARKAAFVYAVKVGDASKINAMTMLARDQVGIRLPAEDMDSDPWLVGVENGTVDLRTGRILEPDQKRFVTKKTAVKYDPDSTADRWERFILEIFNGDEQMADFIQRAVGYSLTGLTTEQCLFFLYGLGSNGKSCFTDTIFSMLGDYACKAPQSLLLERKATQQTNDIAMLKGSRFVLGSETEESMRFGEAQIKDLTGSDRLVGRFHHKEFFSFTPTHSLWIFGNHKPVIRGTDHAIWRRFHLIPFEVQFKKDRNLPKQLLSETPGILKWAVNGCLRWRKDGLVIPDKVTKATDEYRKAEDVIGHFISDRCEIDAEEWESKTDLYQEYTAWTRENGMKALSKINFGKRLKERGFGDKKSHGGVRNWTGIKLLSRL